MLYRIAVVLAAFAAIWPGSSPAVADVIFNFTYFDVTTNTDEGFDHPTFGTARRTALESTAAQIGARLDHTASLDIGVAPSETDASGFIGIAVATFLDTSAGIRDGEIYRRIVLGLPDSDPGFDGSMAFDFGYDVALSGTPAPGVSYFPDVARHEITHMLGFGSFLTATGTGFNNTSPDMYTRFDSFLTTDVGAGTGLDVVDSGGNLLLSAPNYASAYATGFVFDGPATRAANGGLPLKVYPGSPSHSFTPADVMYVSPAIGYARDAWTAVDEGVLVDLGYSIVPEPSTFGPALLGLACLIGTLRRRTDFTVWGQPQNSFRPVPGGLSTRGELE